MKTCDLAGRGHFSRVRTRVQGEGESQAKVRQSAVTVEVHVAVESTTSMIRAKRGHMCEFPIRRLERKHEDNTSLCR